MSHSKNIISTKSENWKRKSRKLAIVIDNPKILYFLFHVKKLQISRLTEAVRNIVIKTKQLLSFGSRLTWEQGLHNMEWARDGLTGTTNITIPL